MCSAKFVSIEAHSLILNSTVKKSHSLHVTKLTPYILSAEFEFKSTEVYSPILLID